MNEELLAHIWSHSLYRFHELASLDGESIRVESPGILNSNAGPDFLHARIRFSDALLIGNVELHVRSSDWVKHHHQSDPNYQNIILHVVYEHDTELGLPCPELELKPIIDEHLLQRYDHLRSYLSAIPCSMFLRELDPLTLTQWKDRWLAERLEAQVDGIYKILDTYSGDWRRVLIERLFRSFGFVVNQVPFELLARMLNRHNLEYWQWKDSDRQALFLGLAGFLEAGKLPELEHHFVYLKHKYRLEPMPVNLWKFHRMRPTNAPCRRISQLADLSQRIQDLEQATFHFTGIAQLNRVLHCSSTAYWSTHVKPGQPCEEIGVELGKASMARVIQNALLPVAFAYAKKWGDEAGGLAILDAFHELPPESNRIISLWKNRGIEPLNAADTQALIHGFKHHCLKKDCLNCLVGRHLIGSTKKLQKK